MAAKKRIKEQLKHDRALVSELMLQHYTQIQMKEVLLEKHGLDLTLRQISNDAVQIQKAWKRQALENYDELMNKELARIDSLEKSIWQAMRESVKGKERLVVEKVRKELEKSGTATDEEHELVIQKSVSTLEGVAASPAYFAQIQDCQKERRKLYGLYAPHMVGVQKTIIVKGYAEVSPSDWPDVIEGEILGTKG
jgi:hypothetical protein